MAGLLLDPASDRWADWGLLDLGAVLLAAGVRNIQQSPVGPAVAGRIEK